MIMVSGSNNKDDIFSKVTEDHHQQVGMKRSHSITTTTSPVTTLPQHKLPGLTSSPSRGNFHEFKVAAGRTKSNNASHSSNTTTATTTTSSSRDSLSSLEDDCRTPTKIKRSLSPSACEFHQSYLSNITSSGVDNSNSSNSITTIGGGGGKIYNPSTSPSIMARKNSRAQALLDSNQKTIDDYIQIQNIENYIPTITNNSTKFIQVTVKIESFIKGFERDVLTDCQPLEHECVSPTMCKTKQKKPQFASVVVSKKNCKSMKHVDTQFKTMVLSPNSKTNLTPNSFQDDSVVLQPTNFVVNNSGDNQEHQHHDDSNDTNDSIRNVKKQYTYEIVSKGFVKGISSSLSQSDLPSLLSNYSLGSEQRLSPDMMVMAQAGNCSPSTTTLSSSPSQISFNSKLYRTLPSNNNWNDEEILRKSSTPPPRLESMKRIEIIPEEKRPRRLTIGSVKGVGEPYKAPVIHQILLTMKQRRNIRDLIDIIDDNIQNDIFEGDWKARLDFLTLSPDSFVLIRDQEFLSTIVGEKFTGFSCFTYAAKKRRIDILKLLCKAQPQKVYENILMDVEQLEKIVELEDYDVIKMLILSLQYHIDSGNRHHRMTGSGVAAELKIQSTLNKLQRRHSHHTNTTPTDKIVDTMESDESESFMRNCVARNFIFIDNVRVVKVILEMHLISIRIASKIAVTLSRMNTLRYFLSKNILKPGDYFEGGNVLHWAVLNRSQEVIHHVCSLKTTKKGHRVNVKRSTISRLLPFNGMTAFEIAKSVYDPCKMSEEENIICEHLHPTKAEFIKGVVNIVVNKVIH